MPGIIGIDLGGTKIAAARFDDDLSMTARARTATPARAADIPEAVAELARQVWERDVVAVGAGVAGLVRWPEGVLAWVPHVAGKGVDLRAELGEALGVPVVVDNDANVAALADFELGVARGYDGGLAVTVGTGIGGGLVVDGAVHRGRSFAGEIGHMRVVAGGVACPCGGVGCWETVASGSALARLAAQAAARDPDGILARIAAGRAGRGEDVTIAAAEGDPAAAAILSETGAWFGVGLANLIAALDPPVIVVGGGLGAVGEPFLGPARTAVRERLYGGAYRPTTPILRSSFGADVGLVGAALLARRATSLRARVRTRTRRLTETLRRGAE